ncbi:MAG: hypothetical protein JKY67_06300, partial [Pseudomonadales bacterium]|nr:hypothetical protein [Pseudomonadales bacterium]
MASLLNILKSSKVFGSKSKRIFIGLMLASFVALLSAQIVELAPRDAAPAELARATTAVGWKVDALPELTDPVPQPERAFGAQLTLDANGAKHLAYLKRHPVFDTSDIYLRTDKELRYAYHDGASWQSEFIDSGLWAGMKEPKLHIDSTGTKHIVYLTDWQMETS